jgi:peptidoglycan hydrolase CwlO-like protein
MARASLLAALLCFAVPIAHADKLDDFKEAVNKKGCESIPYSDLQSNCKSQQSDVHDWCDGGRGPVTCDVGGTRDLVAKLEKEQKNLDALNDKRRDLDDKRSHASDDAEKSRLSSEIDLVDKDIDASKRRIDDLKNDLSKRKDLVNKTIETLGKCIDYRRAVLNVFAYALDKVRGESDPTIKPYAEQLRSKYEESKAGHEQQISNKDNSVDTCKKELP